MFCIACAYLQYTRYNTRIQYSIYVFQIQKIQIRNIECINSQILIHDLNDGLNKTVQRTGFYLYQIYHLNQARSSSTPLTKKHPPALIRSLRLVEVKSRSVLFCRCWMLARGESMARGVNFFCVIFTIIRGSPNQISCSMI